MSTWQPLHGLLSWCPILKSSHENSFEDRAPVDSIYGCPIFKWISLTWWRDRVSLGPSNGCQASTYCIAMLIANIFTHFFHHYLFKKAYCKTHDGCRFYINCAIFKYIVVTAFISISNAIALMWILQDPIDDKSTLVWGIAWCRRATCHYPYQCWLRSITT